MTADPMHDRCPALKPGTNDRCVLYVDHPGDHAVTRTDSWPSAWRFDVPEVPPHVMAFEDRVGWIWVREGAGWLLWRGAVGPANTWVFSYRLYGGDVLTRAPLVECPDPRTETTP